MVRILERLGRTTARHPLLTILGWIIAVVALLGIATASGGAFVNEFRIPGAQSQKAVDLAQEHFPEMGAVSADVIWHTESGTLQDPAKAAAIRAVVADFKGQPDVRSAADPLDPAGGTVSPDGRTAISAVEYSKDLSSLSAKASTRLEAAAKKAEAAGVAVNFRGMVVDLASTPETSGTEFFGVIAALVILLVAFGSVVAAGLPIVIALSGLIAGTALILIAATGIDIPAIAPIIAVMLGLGAGIDYALFVVTRFKSFLAAGMDKHDAAGRALATAGHAVLFAGGTVVAAILSLLLVGIPFIGGIGVAAALVVVMTMVSALTLLPAVLGLLGHRVNALRVGRRQPGTRVVTETGANAEIGRWGAWARQVGERRWVYTAVSVGILLVLAIPLLSLRIGTPDDGNSPVDSTQRKAYDTVSAAFGPGANAPFLVIAQLSGNSGDDAMLTGLTQRMTADREVATVTPPTRSSDGKVAMLTVLPKHAPQAVEVSKLLHRLRDDVAPAAVAGTSSRIYIGGTTGYYRDLDDAVSSRLPWMVPAVLVAAAVLLFLMFRAPLIALQAAVMNLLSIGAAFGVIVAVFQWGWGRSILGIHQDLPVNSMVPMVLFAVLFGLSMDYEVFLLSAVKEEYDLSGDAQLAIQRGVDSTARVITAAAAIMTVVFLSFVPINDSATKMMGVGLAAAVIVDVTLIRMILAPAVMSILGRRAWAGPGRRPTGPTRSAVLNQPASVSELEPDPSEVG